MSNPAKWYKDSSIPNELTKCLGIIEEYDTFSGERLHLVYDILQTRKGSWVFNRGRPEEGFGRRILLWTLLDDPEYIIENNKRKDTKSNEYP